MMWPIVEGFVERVFLVPALALEGRLLVCVSAPHVEVLRPGLPLADLPAKATGPPRDDAWNYRSEADV
jgi:hypothetical protein